MTGSQTLATTRESRGIHVFVSPKDIDSGRDCCVELLPVKKHIPWRHSSSCSVLMSLTVLINIHNNRRCAEIREAEGDAWRFSEILHMMTVIMML